MAGFFQDFLKDIGSGFFGNEYLRDYTHASKTFRTNAYGYSPKFKFLFHVKFEINEQIRDIVNQQLLPDKNLNLGLAVKSIQLPQYTFDTHVMNQYNRKRIIQTKIKYDDINITFHDDNANMIRNLWYAYYTYYYKDATKKGELPQLDQSPSFVGPPAPKSPSGYNQRTTYQPSQQFTDPEWGYIGEGSTEIPSVATNALGETKVPFFKAITVYGFNQHNFSAYSLINPTIVRFGHDTYDYAQTAGTMQNSMTIGYETVKYYSGALDGKRPYNKIPGFGEGATYDQTLSPIARPGSQANILGEGGLVSAAGGFLEDLESGNILGAIQTAGRTYNTFKNPQTIKNAVKSEVLGAITNAALQTPNSNANFKFLSPDSTGAKIAGATNYVNSSLTTLGTQIGNQAQSIFAGKQTNR